MKTTVSNDALQQKYTDYLILSAGLAFMLMAFVLLVVLIMMPKQTAAYPTPMPAPEILETTLDPIQTAVATETQPIFWEGKKYAWELTPRAQFQVVGRVLSRRTYNRDWQAEISPVDLAIGWGKLSDENIDEYVKWRQSGRWYYYYWEEDAPFDETYLRTHSSNFHIVPATESLESILLKIGEDEKILLAGQLIDIKATGQTKQWLSKTSLSRNDSGNGACEILLVDRLIWNGQEYH